LNQQTGVTGYEEERMLLKRYLSDEIAPMIFANNAGELFDVPVSVVVHEIQSWIGDQFRGASNMTAADLIFHAATKLHQLGVLELIPREEVAQFMDGLRPYLLQLCPVEQRAGLETNFGHLEKSTSLAGSSTEVLHKPVHRGGGGYGGGYSGQTSQTNQGGGYAGPPGQTGQGGGSAPGMGPLSLAAPTADPTTLLRLNLLLDTLQLGVFQQQRAAEGTTPQPGAMLAHVVDEVASHAGSSHELETQLGFLKELGVPGLSAGLIQQLGRSLPDWAPPADESVAGAEPPAGAARAMRKVVKLSKDRAELGQRFKELVSVAVEEFNHGSLGRAVTMLDLAGRMIEQGDIEAPIAESVFEESYPTLDPAQLDLLSEDPDRRLLLRRVLRFFPQLHADRMIQQLIEEKDREARLRLLKLLRAHGETARAEAVRALDESVSSAQRKPADVERNLLYLMRAIPSTNDDNVDHEIDLLNRTSDLRETLSVVRESFSALIQLRHPRAYGILAARISELEDGLTATASTPLDAKESRLLLSNTIKQLCLEPDNDSLEIVITHGLKGTPQLGDTFVRLAPLGSQDLSDYPAQVARLTEAINNELPRKFLGMSVGGRRKALILEPLISAVAGTRSPDVQKLLAEIAKNHPDQTFGQKAAEALQGMGRPLAPASRGGDESITLSGDLGLFGLPNLLQNLADNHVSGKLNIVDADGARAASVDFAAGEMVSAEFGTLNQDVAVYQMLERPVEGRFQFVAASGAEANEDAGAGSRNVMSLLMEGMRRFDEFNRARALVPDDAVYKPTGKKATDVKEDRDPELAKKVWGQAAGGVPAAQVERELPIDAFRVRRLYEHWVTEGSLARTEAQD
jgi:hypothetical protein